MILTLVDWQAWRDRARSSTDRLNLDVAEWLNEATKVEAVVSCSCEGEAVTARGRLIPTSDKVSRQQGK